MHSHRNPRVRPIGMSLALSLSIACAQPASKNEPPQSSQAAPQPPAKTEHVFRGKVQQVDSAAKTLTVNGENVEGWMGAMTMVYTPDKPDVFDKVKAGDEITATVHDGDFKTLYDVKVMPASSEK